MRELIYSGQKWLGDVPKNWKVERLQWHLFELNVKNNPIKTETVLSLTNKRGVIPYEEKGAQGNISKENYNEYHLAFKDTIVANSMNILIGSVGYSNYFGCVSPVYYVFKEKNGNDLRFLNYIMQTTQFQKELRKYANGILEIRLRVSSSDILKRMVAVPPTIEEQKNIADFLDIKCAEIDEVLSNLSNQIDILEDYKKEIIFEVCTKGVRKNCKLKDSGMKWIGSIPEHWHTEKIKYNFSRYEVRNPGDKTILSVYRDYGVIPKDSRDDNHNVTSEDTSKYKYVKPGYLAINKMKAWQGSMGVSEYEGVVSPAYFIYVFISDHFNKKYAHYLLRGCYKDELRRISGGIRDGQWDLDPYHFENTLILIPPIEEQNEIVMFLDEKCNKIEAIIAQKQNQIDVLENYKKSLIYEYVTGKKEVPNE